MVFLCGVVMLAPTKACVRNARARLCTSCSMEREALNKRQECQAVTRHYASRS